MTEVIGHLQPATNRWRGKSRYDFRGFIRKFYISQLIENVKSGKNLAFIMWLFIQFEVVFSIGLSFSGVSTDLNMYCCVCMVLDLGS